MLSFCCAIYWSKLVLQIFVFCRWGNYLFQNQYFQFINLWAVDLIGQDLETMFTFFPTLHKATNFSCFNSHQIPNELLYQLNFFLQSLLAAICFLVYVWLNSKYRLICTLQVVQVFILPLYGLFFLEVVLFCVF